MIRLGKGVRLVLQNYMGRPRPSHIVSHIVSQRCGSGGMGAEKGAPRERGRYGAGLGERRV